MVQGIVRHCHSEQWEKQFIYTDVHAWLCGLIHMHLCICVCTCSLVFCPENYKHSGQHYFDGCSDGISKKCIENCGKTC